MRTRIIVGGIFIGVLGFLAYYYFIENHNRKLDEKLINIVTTEFSNLHFQTDGSVVYQEIRSNYKCNRSNIVVVYSSNMSTNEICTSILVSLPPSEWQPVRQWKQDNFCANDEHPADKFNPSFRTTSLTAENYHSKLTLMIKAYPKTATFTFMPVNEYSESEIVLAAKKRGNSFYYVHLEYQADYDTKRYPCNDLGEGCECAYSTFFKSTLKELQRSQ